MYSIGAFGTERPQDRFCQFCQLSEGVFITIEAKSTDR